MMADRLDLLRKPKDRNISASSLVTVEANEWHQHDQSTWLGSTDPDSPSLPADNAEVRRLTGKSIVHWGYQRWFVVAENSRALR